MFLSLISNTTGKVIVNGDDPNLGKLQAGDAMTFSVENPSDYRATEIEYRPFSTDFSIKGIRFTLTLPGRYNLYNALSCIALLSELGIPPGEISRVLRKFRGIERRFDVLLDDGERLVIDDYAHNPHKISSLMEAVQRIREGVCYIFQPHGFAPTKMMKQEYIEAFVQHLRGSDHLVLLPIYYAGGTARRDISSHDLADGIRSGGKSVEVAERKTILGRAHNWNTFVVFGARDETLNGFAGEIAATLKRNRAQ
jgi:UDP-N-acetylmuramate--alanine ligase